MIYKTILMLFTSLGFSMVIGTKSVHYIYCAVLGMLGYVLFLILHGSIGSILIAAIICSSISSIISQIAARKRKAPATIFLLPAILSLIPGSKFFYAISSALARNSENALAYLIETIEYTAGISTGIMLGTTIVKIFLSIRAK